MSADTIPVPVQTPLGGLTALLQQQVGQMVVLQYRHWANDRFAVSEGTFEVVEVDTVWPSVLLRLGPEAVTRLPLQHILRVGTAAGATLFSTAAA